MYILSGPGMTIAGPLWSLQVDEAGDGGGGISGLNVSLERLSDFISTFVSLKRNRHAHCTVHAFSICTRNELIIQKARTGLPFLRQNKFSDFSRKAEHRNQTKLLPRMGQELCL